MSAQDVQDWIRKQVAGNNVVLFMKGTKSMPQCGFSMQVAQILQHLGVDFKDINVLEDMSVREGVINAFHYGNQERPDKKIHLALDITNEKLVIRVMDEGKGFKLSDVPDPLAEENILSTSGRGIFLMRAFMDEFDVVSGRTGGAEIVMSKWLPGAVNAPTNGASGTEGEKGPGKAH